MTADGSDSPAPPPLIAVVGSLNLDLIISVESLPGPGETVIGTASTTAPGGKGANQAAAAATLTGPNQVAMIGRVGDDDAATTVIADLADRGADVHSVRRTDATATGSATVVVEDGGENLIVVDPGANARLSRDDIENSPIGQAKLVLLQLEIPDAVVQAAAEIATGLLVLNPAPARPLNAKLLARVDVLVPNESELRRLAGSAAPEPFDVSAAARLVRLVTDRDVVVTLGERGALVVPTDGEPQLIEPPPVHATDTTGAGDCFCAALSVGLARGHDLISATHYAVAAAALSTTGPGARGALPDDAAVRAIRQTG